jgi:MFS transporter, DHA2 family, methylenomycin A resistance protein
MFKDRSKLLTLLAMCFALFMAMLDNTVVNVALPKIQSSLGSGVSGLQWIVDAYVLMFASLMLTGGTLGDIFGRKRMFLSGLSIFTIASFLCGVAPNLTFLILARGLQGIGAAALMPGTLSILTQTFPDPRERAQAIGIWAGVSGLALALGPVVGGSLVDGLGWQSVFFLNVPIGVIAFFVVTRVVAESKHPEGRTVDLPGQILAVGWLGSLTYALIEGNGKGWASPLISTLLVVAGVGLVAFLVVEHRSKSPMLQLSFFRNRTFAAANTVAAMVSFGMFGMFFFLSLFMQEILGFSAVGAGVRFLPTTGAIIVTAPLAGRLAGRIGSRIPMTIGLALCGTSLLILHGVTAASTYGDFWFALPIMGVGMGLTMTPMTAAVMSSVPRQRSGMASATTNTSREVGGVFGIALLGAILTVRMKTSLTATLTAAGVPDAVRQKVVFAATHGAGGASGGSGGLPGVDQATLTNAFHTAFVTGMRASLLVASIALFVGSAVAFTFVRGHGGTAEAQELAAEPGAEPVSAIA